MPINRKYPLEELIPACVEYVKDDRRRKITWEYVMIDGVERSDRPRQVADKAAAGRSLEVNRSRSIRFPGTDYKTSPADRVDAFRWRLMRAGIITSRARRVATTSTRLVASWSARFWIAVDGI